MSDFDAVMTATIVSEEGVAASLAALPLRSRQAALPARVFDFGTYFLIPIELQGHRDERHNFRR
ncbi:hypothetical protein [Rhizobium ruizarguesonis]